MCSDIRRTRRAEERVSESEEPIGTVPALNAQYESRTEQLPR